MKKIEKEFWVEDGMLALLKGQYGIRFPEGSFSNNKWNTKTNKITISWEEPEKKIEITEEQFWDIANSVDEYGGASKLFRDMFGGGE